jgi:hypothetical protein
MGDLGTSNAGPPAVPSSFVAHCVVETAEGADSHLTEQGGEAVSIHPAYRAARASTIGCSSGMV